MQLANLRLRRMQRSKYALPGGEIDAGVWRIVMDQFLPGQPVDAAGVFFPKPFTDHEMADYDLYMSINRAIFFITRDVVRNNAPAVLLI